MTKGKGEDEEENGEAGEAMVAEVACDTGESDDVGSGAMGMVGGDVGWLPPSSACSAACSTALDLTVMVVRAACDGGPNLGDFSTA